jgi:hypothetical protein
MTSESSYNHDKRQEKENDNGDGIANVMPKLFSIIDRESEFPDYVRPRMRSRITKFTVYDLHKDYQSMDDDDDDGNANDNANANANDNDNDNGKDDVVSNEDYFAAVEALRSIIVEIGDHTKFSPLLLHLIRTRLNEFEAEFLSGTYSDVTQWTFFKLDSSVDTEEQLKTAIHFFPKVLSNGRCISTMDQAMLPINAAALRKEAVPFVPVLAELGRKYNKFEDHQRGGLLNKYTRDRWNGTRRNTALNDLVRGTYPYDDEDDEELRFGAIERLRSMGLLKKEDVQCYNLLRVCCNQMEEKRSKIFEYLVDWNPEALLKSEGWDNGLLPHLVGTSSTYNRNEELDRDVFLTTMQLGFLYFPNEFGFMFHIDQQSGITPFMYLCETYNLREQFSQLCFRLFREPEDSITEYPWKKKEAFMLATDDKVHLDGLYSMVRQDPNLLQHLLDGFD